MKIIGLTGPKGCGKTFVSNSIRVEAAKKLGLIVAINSFAEPMRRMMMAILGGRAFDDLYSRKEEPSDLLCGKSMRHAMQTLGTEWGRAQIGENFWVETAMRTDVHGWSDLVIFDDCRFDNEAEAILDRGGVVIEIIRDSCYSGEDKHASEMGLKRKNISFSVRNDGTLSVHSLIRKIQNEEL